MDHGLLISQKKDFQALLSKIKTLPLQHGFYLVSYRAYCDSLGKEKMFAIRNQIDDAIRTGLLAPPDHSQPASITIPQSGGAQFGMHGYTQVRFTPAGDRLLAWDPSWLGQFRYWFREDSAKTAAETVKAITKEFWIKALLAIIALALGGLLIFK